MKKRNPLPPLGLALALALPLLAAAGCTAKNPDLVEDPSSGPPHALGQITLAESHASSGGSATPIVSALFVPDAKLLKRCTTMLAGCEVTRAPSCGTDPGGGCKVADGESCQYDDSCQPRCVKACTARCQSDEECYFAAPDSPACRKRESFDAGALTFAETTLPLTLFPPYAFLSKGSGAPFLEKASLSVSASGATGAGFEAFQQGFTATTYLRTEPALNKLTRSQVFGGAAVPVRWVAGEDQVTVTVSGIAGAAACPAMDAAGSFDIPAEVVSAVLGERTDVTQQLAIAVSRQNTTRHKGLRTRGTLLTQTVQPEGWLELTTASSESASIQGCGRGTGLCGGGDTCVDLTRDEQNCGKCGNACAASDSCQSARCCGPMACDGCIATAQTGSCKADFSACIGDPGPTGCAKLRDCLTACTSQACRSMCSAMASQSAVNLYNKYTGCLRTACGSVCSC